MYSMGGAVLLKMQKIDVSLFKIRLTKYISINEDGELDILTLTDMGNIQLFNAASVERYVRIAVRTSTRLQRI